VHVAGVNVDKILSPGLRASKELLVASLQTRLLQTTLKDEQEQALNEFLDARSQLTDVDIETAIRLIMATPEYQVA